MKSLGHFLPVPHYGPGGIMRNDLYLRWLAMALVAFGLIACGEDAVEVAPTPTFPSQTGQLQRGSAAIPYQTGPYGLGTNSTIPNLEFIGYPNYLEAALQDTLDMKTIQLADFYNPTGTEVFPEGSPYGAGEPKPKALLLVVSSVWCAPCNEEAAIILPAKYAKYQPMGGEFLAILADGPNQGVPAEPKNLFLWDKKYEVDYPSAIDPGTKMLVDAYPTNFVIRTKDMKILRIGSPDDALWDKFEDILAQ